MCGMSGASCAHKIDLSARKSWCESNDLDFADGLGIIPILSNRERIEAEFLIELGRYNGETQAIEPISSSNVSASSAGGSVPFWRFQTSLKTSQITFPIKRISL
jgi:hypothetical protein